MKEFIDKLIERLEEEADNANDHMYESYFDGKEDGIRQSIEIINELAEEYKDKVMIDGQYCWQTCSATEHCKECNRLCNGSIDYYENYDFMAEEYKGGWIPCSSGVMPKVLQWVLIQTTQGDMDVIRYIGEEECWGNDFYHRIHPRMVVAWCELPAPYTEGE